ARDAQARALDPGADDPDHHGEDDANDRQLDGHPEAAREAAAIERVVEDRQIDAGGFVQPPEPVPDELHRPLPRRLSPANDAAARRRAKIVRAAPGDPPQSTCCTSRAFPARTSSA